MKLSGRSFLSAKASYSWACYSFLPVETLDSCSVITQSATTVKKIVVDIVNDIGFIYFVTLLSSSTVWKWNNDTFTFCQSSDGEVEMICMQMVLVINGGKSGFILFLLQPFPLFVTNLLTFLHPCHDLIWIFYNIRRILNTLNNNYCCGGTFSLPDFDSSHVPNARVSRLDGSGGLAVCTGSR